MKTGPSVVLLMPNEELPSASKKWSKETKEELIIITKTYDFILWMCQHLGLFPRHHRFGLGNRIESGLYTLVETLIQAKYRRQRITLLDSANLQLEILRFQIRLAKDLQCLKPKSYVFASNAVDEIGRMIGGWSQTLRK